MPVEEPSTASGTDARLGAAPLYGLSILNISDNVLVPLESPSLSTGYHRAPILIAHVRTYRKHVSIARIRPRSTLPTTQELWRKSTFAACSYHLTVEAVLSRSRFGRNIDDVESLLLGPAPSATRLPWWALYSLFLPQGTWKRSANRSL